MCIRDSVYPAQLSRGLRYGRGGGGGNGRACDRDGYWLKLLSVKATLFLNGNRSKRARSSSSVLSKKVHIIKMLFLFILDTRRCHVNFASSKDL